MLFNMNAIFWCGIGPTIWIFLLEPWVLMDWCLITKASIITLSGMNPCVSCCWSVNFNEIWGDYGHLGQKYRVIRESQDIIWAPTNETQYIYARSYKRHRKMKIYDIACLWWLCNQYIDYCNHLYNKQYKCAIPTDRNIMPGAHKSICRLR